MSLSGIIQKGRILSSVAVINTATLLLIIYIFQPTLWTHLVGRPSVVARAQPFDLIPKRSPILPREVISGLPVRIEVIAPHNSMHIDLPVDPGYFDPKTGSWTLSDTKAYFAMPSVPANDSGGNTLVYGHNEAHIFSHLSSLKPRLGAHALLHTDNGRVFKYTFEDAKDLDPADVSVFHEHGSPTLYIQTCSGDWFEKRRMYRFSFVEVTP